MLNYIMQQTKEFLSNMPKSRRKKKGQFFTSLESAVFMAELFNLERLPREISVLDPGAGTGILSAAIVKRVVDSKSFDRISLTCYETDKEVLPILKRNMDYISQQTEGKFSYEIIEDDYILSQKDDFNETLFRNPNPKKYDLVIGNPPYLRVMRDDPCAAAMPSVVHGAPNLYFLFSAMALFNLKPEAEMVFIIPRSWTSGAYFKAFRKYFLSEGKILSIHLFVSRDKVFDSEEVLQETMIIKLQKSKTPPKKVIITSSKNNSDFDDIRSLEIPYNAVVNGEELYVYLPTSQRDIDVIKKINTYQKTLPDEGIRMRTGIVVDFRQWDDLRKEPGKHSLPLFYSQHIKDGLVHHDPSGKEYEWITDNNPSLIQRNKNYVFCKRFTAKEEKRRLQAGVYRPSDFKEYEYIGTQNKINYVDRVDGTEMDEATTYGVFALLNSTLFDMYYRILNGSTQVNSTEINHIPVPPSEIIKKIGDRVIASHDLSTDNCDRIVLEVAYA